MKVKLNQSVYLKGEHHEEGETLEVSDRLGGAWIQTGKADEVFSKEAIFTPDREQADDSGREDPDFEVDSESDD